MELNRYICISFQYFYASRILYKKKNLKFIDTSFKPGMTGNLNL